MIVILVVFFVPLIHPKQKIRKIYIPRLHYTQCLCSLFSVACDAHELFFFVMETEAIRARYSLLLYIFVSFRPIKDDEGDDLWLAQ